MLLLGLLLSCPALLFGQTYGNEWIKHDQQYLRIKVAADGIYKLTFQQMEQAGFPVGQISPNALQLFHRGQEQAIHVEGEGDGVLNTEDYVIFYGRRNDGTLDKELYLSPDLQPHNYYNLYSDTTAYYLTFQAAGIKGKRMSLFSEGNSGSLAAEPFYWVDDVRHISENYSAGRVYGFGANDLYTYHTYGDEGEGWFSNTIANTSRDFSFTGLSDLYTSGPASELTVQLVGRNNNERNVQLQVGSSTSNLSQLQTVNFSGYTTLTVQENLPWSAMGTQLITRVTALNAARVSVAYLRLRYPRRWNMNAAVDRQFRLSASTAIRYVEIENVPENAVIYDVTNPDQPFRIAHQREGSTIKAILPASVAAEQVLHISSLPRNIPTPKALSFRKLPKNGTDFIIISHQRLMKAAGGYDNPIRAYSAYRASTAGGGYDTLAVDVQELYDQFSYGEYTPVAIRRFVQYASQEKLPKYLFLIGKSLSVVHRRSLNNTTNIDFVPTFGHPGADIPFTAQIQGSGYAPAIPVGRLSVRTPEEVAVYLRKVIEDETVTPKSLWLKRLVHLAGGGSAAEARQLKSYLRSYENIAKGPFLGAEVATLSKTENVVVQEIDISKDVNEGVRLITFFGHSAPDLTDIEIGYVSQPRLGYNNKGLYPRILINGCSAGDIFNHNRTFGEDWIYTADKGAINFIAHSGYGYSTMLHHYSTYFYRIATADENFAGASIGNIHMATAQRYLSGGTASTFQITQAQQMVLQGDPVLTLFEISKSDFETNNDHVSIRATNNQPLNTSADSIAISVVIRNYGKAVQDSLPMQLEYWLADNTPKIIDYSITEAVYHQDTAVFRIGVNQLEGAGLSNFRVTLNPGLEIPEFDYMNNIGTIQVVIPAGGTLNIVPQNYAVVKKDQVKIIAQGTDLLHPIREYKLKLDTAYSLASAVLQEKSVSSKTIAMWQAVLPEVKVSPADTIVYYWSSKLADPAPTEDPASARSSFTYIKDAPEGWAQAHEGQFSEDKLISLQVAEGRKWQFTTLKREVEVTTWGAKAPSTDYRNVELMIDNVQYIINEPTKFCANNSMNAVQFDKNTMGTPLAKIPGFFRSESCGRVPQIISNFQAGDVVNGNNDGYNLERYLKEIPEGDWVLLFSIGTNNYTQWPESVKQQVLSLGVDASVLSQLTNGEPIVILGKKGGSPGSAVLAMADKSAGSPAAAEQTIQLSSTVTGIPGVGFVESGLIGPAASWQDVAILVTEDASDHWELSVIGVNAQNQETILMNIDKSGTSPLMADAATYPYMRLRLQAIDTAKLSPPQLKFWRVGYESLPEGVLLVSDTVKNHHVANEGQLVRPGFKFVNVSEKSYKADSLDVFSNLLNVNSSQAHKSQLKVKAPAPGDTIRFGLTLETRKNMGVSNLLVKVNPKPGTEVNLQNNVFDARRFLTVRGDSLHPFIDVAFDGSYITNGEIVSANPLISVIMRDENKFKLKQDTTGIHLYLKRPCESCTFERVNLSNPNVRFLPASTQEDCKVEFSPGMLEDGIYTLQVQAEDASGNKAGTKPYSISFEVVSESSLTHFYPYPNPFSTSTRFVFTLTGSEIPEDLKIQIMSVSGKVVREIMKEELGPLRIGNNMTQYAWDGTDEWGDRLANGVYLYRVVLGGSAASEWKHRATKGDKAFKHEFGKLYILR